MKKVKISRKYKKGVALPFLQIKEMIKATTDKDNSADILNHTVYDDGSQSVTVTIHFMPNELTND